MLFRLTQHILLTLKLHVSVDNGNQAFFTNPQKPRQNVTIFQISQILQDILLTERNSSTTKKLSILS
jgi:hypothetical protein